jgi:hypothetical protein
MPGEDITPDGRFYALNFNVPVNNEYVTNDNLFTSPVANQGIIHKLMCNIAWLYDRAGDTALISTNGAGAAAVEWQSGRADDSDWITSVTVSSSSITVNIASTFADIDDWAVEATIQRSTAAGLGTRRFTETAKNPAGTSFVIRLVSDAGADADPSANAYKVFVRLTRKASLHG